MALLNPPDILPEAMRFLVRALLAARDQELDRSELVSLVAPRGLTEAMDSIAAADGGSFRRRPGRPQDRRAPSSPRASLDGLRTLRPRQAETADRVKLAGSGGGLEKPSDASPGGMGRVLLDAVIQMGDSDVSHGIGDLIQAVVLLHTAEQPLRPFDTFECRRRGQRPRFRRPGRRKLLGPVRKDNWPVPNPEQWQPLRRWASYLGLARTVGRQGLIPDASEALHPATARDGAGRLSTCATSSRGAPRRCRSWTAARCKPVTTRFPREIMRCFPAACPSRCSNSRRTGS